MNNKHRIVLNILTVIPLLGSYVISMVFFPLEKGGSEWFVILSISIIFIAHFNMNILKFVSSARKKGSLTPLILLLLLTALLMVISVYPGTNLIAGISIIAIGMILTYYFHRVYVMFFMKEERREVKIIDKCGCLLQEKVVGLNIKQKVDTYLDEIKVDAVNWRTLYRCRICNTFWEEHYTGGRWDGAPELLKVSSDYVSENWGTEYLNR